MEQKKGDDYCSRLTAAELDFLDWYDMLDDLQQAVVDLLINQAAEIGKGFFDIFWFEACPAHLFDVGLSLAA